MTDLPSSLDTHTAPISDYGNTALPNGKPLQASGVAASPIEEEEDYTIRCFCGFQVDDGNTVYCERCDTWQHIECYYFEQYRNGQAPDVGSIDHACVNCAPRPYDKKSAIDRQTDRFLPDERRSKKAPTKPIKKRAKLSEPHSTLANGYSNEGYDHFAAPERTSGSPRDHGPPPKRPKTTHRNSGSVSLHAGPFASKSQSSRKTSKNMAHPPSVLEYFDEPPSPEFLRLYEDDPGDAPLQANIFNDIGITRNLSLWSHDVESLGNAANGLQPAQIFHRLGRPLDSMVIPQLHKEHRVDKSVEIAGRHPQWIFLTTENEMAKESIVGELRGRVGHMQTYCQDSANRWDYLRHPAPFVFFHPKLPIYIDARQEGSTCRYLRRSCRPNVEFRTILENGSDYRFIFIAKEDLPAGAELTISWTFDEHIRRCVDQLSNPIKQEGSVDAEAAYVSDWVQKVLSNYGGCACESAEDCGLVKWLRPRDLPLHSNGSSERHPKGRSGPSKATPNPDLANGSNSRASSEGMKRTDDEDRDRSRSTSGSKTPIGYASGVPSLEISDREKRKIAAAEKTFEQIEHERHQPANKRKKRSSGGSTLNTPVAATSVRTYPGIPSTLFTDHLSQRQLGHGMAPTSQPNTPSLSAKPRYTDASTSGKISGSPIAKSSRGSYKRPVSNAKRSHYPTSPSLDSPLGRQNYVHRAVQTDAMDFDNWDRPDTSHNCKRKVYISLGKRLLMRCQQDREKPEEYRKLSATRTTDYTNFSVSSHGFAEAAANGVVNGEANGMHMSSNVPETQSSFGPDKLAPDIPVAKPRPPDKGFDGPDAMEVDIKPPPPPPAFTAKGVSLSQTRPINGFRRSELRVQLPSANNLSSHDPGSAPPMVATTAPTVTRSSFSHKSDTYPPLFSSSTPSVIVPSPVKKVSLGEYFSRRKTESQINTQEKATGSSPTMESGVNKDVSSGGDENKSPHPIVNGTTKMTNKDEDTSISGKASAP